ncbi:gamma-glutamyltransferase [Sphingomonas sp. BIUV-7]|uniref:Glutathione hydrolase proenzyme n=1 Tax=Sphingomonas natans TaxID=3063330 RepID=A0ABT8YEA9_9SPHN|nr:gamma-glutamyltransferase [Sphingomonas sp. BIUV-7]MDO6416678.1 gamma-glutamyltransferase [Sphingomonas sp. BIUV-7]
MLTRPLLALAAASLAFSLPAAAKPPAEPGMVSAADPRATAAGAEILRAGGSAADAAVAMMLALSVVEPGHSGLGGGGFLVFHDAARHATVTYDGREAAPKAADPHWFYGADGEPMTHAQAVPGGRSVGVPGSLRLMAAAHAKYGKLPWARLFQPAIRLATEGWAISPRFYNFISRPTPGLLNGWPVQYLYDADGKAKIVGTILKNPEQAALLQQIATKGPDSFYAGPTAKAIVATVNGSPRNPSKMTEADLAGYRVKERAPVCGTYRTYRICGMGPPSGGGVAVLQILKQLERFDMATLGKDNPVAWHLFAESSRLAYADRDAYLGDPDHVTVPLAGLLAADYIAGRSALLSETGSMAVIAPGKPAGAPARVAVTPGPEHGTTDLVAVDHAGNVVEITTTIESVFGSGLTTNGIFLNNELTDFDTVPDRDGYLAANSVAGGKRPRSSMSPTIVYNPDGTVRIAIGAAGGSTIIAQVAKALIGVIDWKMSAQDAIAMGLIFSPGQTAVAEKATQAETMVPALLALGEKIVVAPLGLKANAIEWVGGHWVGAADPRSEGVSQGETGAVVVPKKAAAIERPSE